MSGLLSLTRSSVGKKIITGVTGFALMAFLVIHLIGNYVLLLGRDAFNGYAYFLHHFLHGGAVIVAEIILLAFFLFHIAVGLNIWLRKNSTRGSNYEVRKSAGGATKMTFSSRSMAITGLVLLAFTAYHLIHFKFGPDLSQGYVAKLDGKDVRDLYQLVIDEFQKLGVVIFYVVCMLILGLHLRHGFWSAFQSLGLLKPTWAPAIFGLGLVFAAALAFGFLLLPILIYFGVGA